MLQGGGDGAYLVRRDDAGGGLILMIKEGDGAASFPIEVRDAVDVLGKMYHIGTSSAPKVRSM